MTRFHDVDVHVSASAPTGEASESYVLHVKFPCADKLPIERFTTGELTDELRRRLENAPPYEHNTLFSKIMLGIMGHPDGI